MNQRMARDARETFGSRYIREYGIYLFAAGLRVAKPIISESLLEIIHHHTSSEVEIQLLNADLMATRKHLYFAVLNALKAFRTGKNISKSLKMEIMLYASAQRQISKATLLIGIKPSTANIAVAILGKKTEAIESALSMIKRYTEGTVDDRVFELSRTKIGRICVSFEISDLELETMRNRAKDGYDEAIVSAIIERMALVATQN